MRRLLSEAAEYIANKRRKKIWNRVVICLACAVVFGTAYALILPAITLEGTAYCGYEEHQHNSDCYTQTLVCDMPEEQESGSGHVHDESCYEEVLTCDKEEHVHSLSCFSNPEADLESAGDWERTLPDEWSGDRAEDLIAVAKSQLGYKESSKNYTVTDDETKQGYTRYGEWYGDPYGDWSAMFVSFCLNYAGIPEEVFPQEASCSRWIDTLKKDYDLYHSAGSYAPVKGDIVFLDTDGDGKSDHAGVVVDADEQQIQAIVGDSDDKVQKESYYLDDKEIRGYGALPQSDSEEPADLEEEPTDSEEKAADNDAKSSDDSGDSFALKAETEDGLVVQLSGAADSLPYPEEELKLTVEYVDSDKAKKLMDEAVGESELTDQKTYLLDICLWHGEEEVEPTGPVTLSVVGASTEEEDKGKSVKVYHIDEDKEQVTDMDAEINEKGEVVIDTDHFSVYGIVIEAGGAFTITSTISATWDDTSNSISSLTFTATNSDENVKYIVQYRDNDGGDWEDSGAWTAQINKGQSTTLDATAALMNAPINRIFRVYATGGKGTPKTAYSTSVSLVDILDSIKVGFSDWLENSYVQDFSGTEPTTTQALYDAFAQYKAMPELTISTSMNDDRMYVEAVSDPELDNATYSWQYQDENGAWQTLCDDTTSSVDVSQIAVLQDGGKQVRCRMMDSEGTLKAISNSILVNPRRSEYDTAIAEINEKLKEHFTYATGKTSDDLSINGAIFTSVFYYGNVAADPNVPFYDAQSYADYLAKLYIDGGQTDKALETVRAKWDYYLYDLYDPDWKTMGNRVGDYPTTAAVAAGTVMHTMGDEGLGWPKASMSSFHGSATSSGRIDADGSITPTIKNLEYKFGEDDVDYSKFISNVKKKATAKAAGDANTERKYDIDISADGMAKVDGPVAMILQIQTSWQMFDMLHANSKKNDGKTQVGSVASNTELANLYAIKHALLRFVDYMEEHYRGNNLVLGITEVQHNGSSSMFGPAVNKPNTTQTGQYVTNDYDMLRQGIINWDSFGNCEHVHYDTNSLEAAANNISNNLSGWMDQNGQPLNNKVRKVGVIIGGPTENTEGDNGYACTLPWDTLNKKLNAVYGIRTNEGTSRNTDPPQNVISWLDYTTNKDNFTEKYVATTEEAIYQKLIEIAKQEMRQNMINSGYSEHISVDDVILKDTISAEFELDATEPITVTIKKTEDDTVIRTETLSADQLTVETDAESGTTTVSYNVGTLCAGETAVLHFTVKAKEDYIGSNNVFTNEGTPSATYTHTKSTGTEEYSADGQDTPQVNVPIRFTTVDGDTASIIVGESVDLADLSTAIAQNAEDLVDNYGQINGTLSYTWVLPDGTEVDAGRVTVTDGSIGEQSFPSRSSVFEGTAAGQYTGTLKVTFTPETVDSNNPNFSNSDTAVAVNPLTNPGKVWINVVASDSTERFFVRKEWIGTPPEGTDSIKFHVLSNGEEVLDENGEPIEYELSDNNGWETVVDGLPAVKDGVIQNYTVEEINVPEGYLATYSSENRVENDYAARVTLSFKPSAKKDNVILKITYTYHGEELTYTVPQQTTYKKDETYSFVVEDLPLNENGEPYPCQITSIVNTNDRNKDLAVSTSSATAEKYLRGSVNTEVKVITNAPAYELPKMGGIGTSLYTIGGLLLIAVSLLYGYKLRRKRERRSER